MNEELRERREETYRMIVAHGLPQAEVVARLSEQYGVTKNAIRRDINQMPEWLPDLSVDFGAGIIRLTRLRDQQQELERIALEAQRDGNLNAVIGARREIRKSIMTEEKIAGRMGLAPEGEATDEEEPWADPIENTLSQTEHALIDDWCGVSTHPTYITDDDELVRVDEDGNVYDDEDELIAKTSDEDLLPGDDSMGPPVGGE